ncbi:unnamed protein product, partial [Prunus brigantina]
GGKNQFCPIPQNQGFLGARGFNGFRGELPFSPIFFLFFPPLFMAKSDEGKKMGAPAGLRDSIFPCVPIPLGFLNACTWNLFSQQPLTCESLAFFVAFCFSQVLKALDSFYSNVEAIGLFPLLCLPTFEPKKMGLSPEAPKRPETSISRPINGPHDNSLPSIPQPTQASPGHLSLGPLKLVVRLGGMACCLACF